MKRGNLSCLSKSTLRSVWLKHFSSPCPSGSPLKRNWAPPPRRRNPPTLNASLRKHKSQVAFIFCILNTDLSSLQLLDILQGSVSFFPPSSHSLFENELCMLNILDSAAVNIFRLWITPLLLGEEEFKTTLMPNFKKKEKGKNSKALFVRLSPSTVTQSQSYLYMETPTAATESEKLGIF